MNLIVQFLNLHEAVHIPHWHSWTELDLPLLSCCLCGVVMIPTQKHLLQIFGVFLHHFKKKGAFKETQGLKTV